MSSVICQIQPLPQSPTTAIFLSKSLMKQWNCTHGELIEIELGNKSAQVRIFQNKRPGYFIILSSTLARQLVIPFAGSTRTRASFHDKKLRLGPVIGILTTGFTGNMTAPFGARTLLFRNFLLASEIEKPFFYVFTPEMINWQNKTVIGYYYKKDNSGEWRWMRSLSPLPDVVYERVPNRKAESLARVQSCLLRLKESTHCQVFNQGFFNKWTIYQLIKSHPQTASYSPESQLNPTSKVLKNMLDKYKMVYLKPSGGSLGMGIFRITHHPTQGYFSRFHQGEKSILHRFRTLENLLKFYFKNNPDKLKNYLVQQGIRLLKVNGRPVDFRVHMHKDSTGKWKVVGIAAKVAGLGSVTTHVRTGGSVFTDDLLKEILPNHAQKVKEMLVQAAVEIAEVLEEKLSGPLGELGMDMGIDQNQRIWLFEVNSKPGRHIFHHPNLREAGRQSAKYITEYSLKLAEFV
ncbi:YheC/YheD family protein [Thermoflavimicrobium daqui]|jgi:hypothetical protein|uniref:YheC/YheD family protein n=1 Tax=Thermoflavimicrobium daqui TaxID=2137476 RepID=A0A364K982_9BACL|nr:YheC/YheD family protein [Thermoflavimicrobium daqui]RAL26855.1 hypothetical protein DL897_02055 [Thermoflavimicrobium daqui]